MAVSQQQIVTWRRHLHTHPELSFQEVETTAFIAKLMQDLGLEPVRRTKTGLWVDIHGGDGPTVVVRADIDALPIHEEVESEIRSQHDGVMHACGHDGHTGIALGVAHELAKEKFPGTIRVLFQHAEESTPGGAREMIAAGVLEGAKAVIGLHLWSPLESGVAEIGPGPITANADDFTIQIQGRGGHAALPQQGVDAILIGARIVDALQAIVSRRADPMRPAVVTIGKFHSGTASNAIADTAALGGTVRTVDDETRDLAEREIARIAEAIATSLGGTAVAQYNRGYPAVINEPQVSEVMAGICRHVLGAERVRGANPTMVGEDFAYYQREIPGAFLMLGAGGPDHFPHHHPRFTIEEDVFTSGVQILKRTALQLLEAPIR